MIDDLRRQVATIVERHLDEILDQMMEVFAAEIPAIAAADEGRRRRVRGNVRQTLLAFLGIYADPASPARVLLDEARKATIERAGETFERDDIVAMLRIARHVVFGMTRGFVSRELQAGGTAEADIDEALDAFLQELERPERRLTPTEEALTNLLILAEAEGKDIR